MRKKKEKKKKKEKNEVLFLVFFLSVMYGIEKKKKTRIFVLIRFWVIVKLKIDVVAGMYVETLFVLIFLNEIKLDDCINLSAVIIIIIT